MGEQPPTREDGRAGPSATTAPPSLSAVPWPPDLVLTPAARNPIRLPDETVRAVLDNPLPVPPLRPGGWARTGGTVRASVVVITHNNLLFTKMCLASLLAHTEAAGCEVIVVDNGSGDGTPEFLRRVA